LELEVELPEEDWNEALAWLSIEVPAETLMPYAAAGDNSGSIRHTRLKIVLLT